MGNRIIKATEDYKKTWKGKAANFYPEDITNIIKQSGGRIDAIVTALEAGYMLGYRKAQKDARKASKI